MTIQVERVMPFAEYAAMDDRAVARGFYRNDRRVFLPGIAWFQPFYFDPHGEMQSQREPDRREEPFCRRGDPFLSIHYWSDWADKRPPICVMCPNGEVWEIDRKSSNGDGWVVTGFPGPLIVSPSIVVPGYHGFLGSGGADPGWFTGDIEARGPTGVVTN